jgi:hypothetical protein
MRYVEIGIEVERVRFGGRVVGPHDVEKRFSNDAAAHEILIKWEHGRELAAGQHQVKRAIREIVENCWTD